MKRLKNFFSFKSAGISIVYFFVLFLQASNIAAQPYPKEVSICFGDFKPFEYQESDQIKGMNVEILETIAESFGITIQWSVYPWARCLHMAEEGTVDGLVSLYWSAERDEFLYFPNEHINVDECVFFTYPGSNVVFDGTLKSLTGLKVLTAHANSYGREFDEAENIIKVNAPNTVNVVRMIAMKRYQIGIGSIKAVQTEIKARGYEKKLEILKPSYYIKTYFAFSKKKGPSHKALTEDFSDALRSYKKSGEYERTLKKYGYWNDVK
jgi:polar amino acid transport system substrate-binding protein